MNSDRVRLRDVGRDRENALGGHLAVRTHGGIVAGLFGHRPNNGCFLAVIQAQDFHLQLQLLAGQNFQNVRCFLNGHNSGKSQIVHGLCSRACLFNRHSGCHNGQVVSTADITAGCGDGHLTHGDAGHQTSFVHSGDGVIGRSPDHSLVRCVLGKDHCGQLQLAANAERIQFVLLRDRNALRRHGLGSRLLNGFCNGFLNRLSRFGFCNRFRNRFCRLCRHSSLHSLGFLRSLCGLYGSGGFHRDSFLCCLRCCGLYERSSGFRLCLTVCQGLEGHHGQQHDQSEEHGKYPLMHDNCLLFFLRQ